MTKLRELWSKAKSAISGGLDHAGGGDNVTVTTKSKESEHLGGSPAAEPAVDILESDKELLIVADVPGARRRDALVSMDSEGALVLYAKVDEGGERSRMGGEYRTTDWYRSFRLPSAFDGNRAQATLANGVLTVRVPRRKESAPRLIPVKARG